MQFSEKIKELRLKKGISQAELAEKIFVSRSAVAKWENGLGLPSEESLKLLAEFFEVGIDELYSDKTTESVIVSKNVAISKSKKTAIVITAVCLAIIIALIVTVCVVISNVGKGHENVIEGDSTADIVGIKGTIYELVDENRYKPVPTAGDVYFLAVEKTYILIVQFQLTGGSRVIMPNSDGISFTHNNDIIDIELIEKESFDPKYTFTVKTKCENAVVTIKGYNFTFDLKVITE